MLRTLYEIIVVEWVLNEDKCVIFSFYIIDLKIYSLYPIAGLNTNIYLDGLLERMTFSLRLCINGRKLFLIPMYLSLHTMSDSENATQ